LFYFKGKAEFIGRALAKPGNGTVIPGHCFFENLEQARGRFHAQARREVGTQFGTVFLGRVEVDQTLSRPDQQLDFVEGVIRHLDSSSAKSQSRIVHSLFRDWRAISARGDHFAW
jgi:hypothetical protein